MHLETNGKCSVCGGETVCEEVGYGVDKCIFHCDKSDEAKWGNYESEDVKRFWRAIREQIKKDIAINAPEHDFQKYHFPALEYASTIEEEKISDNFAVGIHKNECLFWVKNNENIKSTFYLRTRFDNAVFQYSYSLYDVKFNDDVYFVNVVFNGTVEFDKITFEEQVSFENAIFYKNIKFDEIRFKDRAYFGFVHFKAMVQFILIKSDFIVNFNNAAFDAYCHVSIVFGRDFCELSLEDTKFSGNTLIVANGGKEVCIRDTVFANTIIFKITSMEKCYFLEVVFEKNSNVDLQLQNINELIIGKLIGDSDLSLTNCNILKRLAIKNTILNDVQFNGLSLEHVETIELDNTSFIGSHLTNVQWGKINESRFRKNDREPIDRQMARQLKAINDAQGETVIANDFYALEMRLRSKELNWREHFGEKLVQNIHELVSNHSNDWALSTIWFFAFAFLFAALAKGGLCALPLLLLFVVIGHGVYEVDKPTSDNSIHLSLAILGASFVLFCLFSCDFEFLVALVNPLNFKDSKDLLSDSNTNLVLIYACRIVEIFIGYQIITAIRKNTRRK